MDYFLVLAKHYEGWQMTGDTYDDLVWDDDFGEKPTIIHLQDLWDNMVLDVVREKRNQLLKDCDYCALPDYPNRENFILYRQELRELPENWTIDKPFPQKPT